MPVIKEVHDKNVTQFTKDEFSMLEKPVWDYFKSLNRPKVVLYGIEAHVCVKQTALDLVDRGIEVHLVVDGVSSIKNHDRNVGLKSLELAGVHMTTYESLVFELMRTHKHEAFKSLLNVIKDNPKEPLDWIHKL